MCLHTGGSGNSPTKSCVIGAFGSNLGAQKEASKISRHETQGYPCYHSMHAWLKRARNLVNISLRKKAVLIL